MVGRSVVSATTIANAPHKRHKRAKIGVFLVAVVRKYQPTPETPTKRTKTRNNGKTRHADAVGMIPTPTAPTDKTQFCAVWVCIVFVVVILRVVSRNNARKSRYQIEQEEVGYSIAYSEVNFGRTCRTIDKANYLNDLRLWRCIV
jgi:hypothetical protein